MLSRAVAKLISAAAIHGMRMQLKHATGNLPLTHAQRNAARRVKVVDYKANVLAWAQTKWDAAATRLRGLHGPLCPVELGIGMRPERYCPSLGDLYQRTRNDSTY